ncbi:efflux RND transporter periplasmic adaptor subunit [Ascidiimonas aurantiaca]|uniref:efflux RND transporter periplasmic adaptor subunit n=1 Tax=Ascidiimonas aurantiaca TaxID=1685432 RepID=UPI0030EF6C36
MKRIKLYILNIGALLFIVGCETKVKNGAQEIAPLETRKDHKIVVSKHQFKTGNMQIGKLFSKPFPELVEATGMIDVPPENKAVINTIAGGYIKETPLLIGDKVTKGQALVTLENPEFITLQQEYLDVKAQLHYLKAEYERQTTLLEEKITSLKNQLQAESAYKRAVAAYQGLRKKMEMLHIDPKIVESGKLTAEVVVYSPISGNITELYVNKGAYVSPADVIMEVIDKSHIHLELSVFESDIMRVKEKQDIIFKVPETSGTTYRAHVYLIGTSIHEKDRTVKVHAHIEEELAENFATGMFVEAAIVTRTDKRPALPEEAVIMADNSYYVWQLISENDSLYVFSKKEIQPGSSYKGFVSIDSVFSPEDRFLTKGGFNLIGKSDSGSGHSH